MDTTSFLLRLPLYKAYKRVEIPGVTPFSYVFLLSTKCNSHCRTCGLWKAEKKDELSTKEWLKVIDSIGRQAAWVTVTGGEPFMLPDIDKILKAVIEKNRPRVLCIPTNGSMPGVIYKKLESVLSTGGKCELIVNISVDEIGEKHDAIRGLQGGFAKVIETIKLLRRLKKRYPRLKIGVNTVISEFNASRIGIIKTYVATRLMPDDHIFETAQERLELKSIGIKQGSSDAKVKDFLQELSEQSRREVLDKRGISAFKAWNRANYYRAILKPRKTRCNAGILSCQIMPNGDVVDCGVKGDVIANLKQFDMDFKKLWKSQLAAKERADFRKRRCACELANIFYINRF